MFKSRLYLSLILLVCLSGCNLANHGSFVTQSFHLNDGSVPQLLSKVSGESCQTSVLYFIPYGESASTANAIADAKSKVAGTQFLADITIDDEFWFEFGYSVQCIIVSATAYGDID